MLNQFEQKKFLSIITERIAKFINNWAEIGRNALQQLKQKKKPWELFICSILEVLLSFNQFHKFQINPNAYHYIHHLLVCSLI